MSGAHSVTETGSLDGQTQWLWRHSLATRKARGQAALSLGVLGIISHQQLLLGSDTKFSNIWLMEWHQESRPYRAFAQLSSLRICQDLPWGDRPYLQGWGWTLLLEPVHQCRGAGSSVTDEHQAAANNNSS